ncbi:hypothetical protein COLO4_26875 [Corchorus olitorius]|uniref:SET domain-containing protein n=1 Tax=Corchorus olitorius TaxID=93759 RepID=A0A1R3HTQ4_9ROSI|nr:hypothetical protein COLO4_26875 [Corchorus olitorius]
MGVSDNMLHKETSKVASSSLSEGLLGKVPAENGHIAPTPKYKQRRVSAIRDYPPGCGRLAAPVTTPSEQAQGPKTSESENPVPAIRDNPPGFGRLAAPVTTPCEQAQGPINSESENLVLSDLADKSECDRSLSGDFELGMHLVNGISELQKDIPQNIFVNSKEGVVPQSGLKLHSVESSLEMALTRSYPPRRGVTAVRDFPPFCGRNAPALSEEERMKWLTSLKNKGFNLESYFKEEKPPEKNISTDMKQLIKDCQDVNDPECGVEHAAPRLSAEEIQSKPEKPASEKLRTQGADEASSMNDMEEDKECMEERSIKSPCETFSNEFDSKSKEATETSDNTRGLDMVVYENDKSSENKLYDSSAVDDRWLEEYCASQDALWDRSIAPIASSSSPLQQGKMTGKRDSAGGSFKKRRKNEFILLPRAKSTLVADKNDAKSSVETCTNKNSCPTKRADQSIGQVATWNNNDSLQQDGPYNAQIVYRSPVSLPPTCPSRMNNNNGVTSARSKVREALRLFQVICRKLLQEEESKLIEGRSKSKRVDLQAAKILKEKGYYVNNTGKSIVGPVPGVEVGDEFQYFVELNIVGLHRPSQGGIDYAKQGEKVVATCVIASGGYEDDLDNSDVLIYMGQGGNVMQKGKQPEDQKLERGNLALANSETVKNPVRVVRGGTRFSDVPECRGKIYKTYVYDGLYKVEDYKQEPGPHGKLVYKFTLVRIPGQPELAWKVVKKSNKSRAREGLCSNDISEGDEEIPICAVNTIDGEKPPRFNYVRQMIYPNWYRRIPPKGCDCTSGCSESGNCSCVVKNGGEIPYNHNGSIVESKPLVYECGPACKCPPSCYNRVSQKGIKLPLEIFKTELRGWGVRCRDSILSGSFICEYAGELLKDKEAEKRTGNDEYLFDIGNDYGDSSFWDGLQTLMPDAHSSSQPVVQDSGFTIDAARCGNIGRLINHSCSPNLYAQNVLYDHDDRRIPHIMFFAAENIPPLQELTYHYNYMIDQVLDDKGNIKKKICYCGSTECTGRLY